MKKRVDLLLVDRKISDSRTKAQAMIMAGQIFISGKKVLIRVDYNVPIQDGLVIDNYRIKASLPTINYCLKREILLFYQRNIH